jgi:hypothetical protein
MDLPLSTPRLLLRPFALADAPAIHADHVRYRLARPERFGAQ